MQYEKDQGFAVHQHLRSADQEIPHKIISSPINSRFSQIGFETGHQLETQCIAITSTSLPRYTGY